MEIVKGPNTPNIPKYRINCFHCGAELIYTINDVHRQPWFNKIVQDHGFTGHTGEVHCPCCGTWLPHYENNRIG